jgi:hypothetical protein
MTAVRRRGRSVPRLFTLLQRFAEILPSEKLQSLQTSSEQGTLTDGLLLQRLGIDGQTLIGLGLAASTNAAFLHALPEGYLSQLRELGEHVKANAPALLEHPKIRSIAQKFSEAADRPDANLSERELPFDDISGVRTSPTYLSVSERLIPTIRAAISFSNRKDFPSISLRFGDVAFLTTALLGSLANAIEDCDRVAACGLLEIRELEGIRQWLAEMDAELSKLKSGLESPSFTKTQEETTKAK